MLLESGSTLERICVGIAGGGGLDVDEGTTGGERLTLIHGQIQAEPIEYLGDTPWRLKQQNQIAKGETSETAVLWKYSGLFRQTGFR